MTTGMGGFILQKRRFSANTGACLETFCVQGPGFGVRVQGLGLGV